MYLSMAELLDHANKNNYAVAAPNVSMELDARAALEAAEELHAPIILDLAYISTADLIFTGRYIAELCKASSVPAALNLDHGSDFNHIIQAIRGGFSSVMMDCSTLPYEENVKNVKEVVKIAHAVGVSVEAELGHVGLGSDILHENMLTDPKEASRFIKHTGIDCLAVSIGTAHGKYKYQPKIDFERLAAIKKATGNFPLVLHGGSGSGDENIRKVCQMGINKVNVATELFEAAYNQLLNAKLTGSAIYSMWDHAKQGYKESLKRCIILYGSEKKAWMPRHKGITSVSF
jgi:fructose-bisphosphate aldolase class II